MSVYARVNTNALSQDDLCTYVNMASWKNVPATSFQVRRQGVGLATCLTSATQPESRDLSDAANYSQPSFPRISLSPPTQCPSLKPVAADLPNAFVSVRITSPSIRQHLQIVQEAMVEKDESIKFALTSLDKLHVTLSVVHLADEDEQERYLKQHHYSDEGETSLIRHY